MSTASLRVNEVRFTDGANTVHVFDVKAPEYGAKGDGVTDDTAAIDAAATAAGSAVVYLPAGNYVYNGTGRTGSAMKFQGAGKDSTVITLGTGKYFVDDNQLWNSFQMRGLRFEGGAGAIRNRFTGTNVANFKEVDDCYFNGFTGAAISSNAIDDPYWKITRSIFMGGNMTTAIGVALSGLTDSSAITDCEFLKYKVGVKLGAGGNNARITNSAFLQFAAGTSRAAIWVVPQTAEVNAGQGLVVSNIKFGNENQDTSDYRILYADESTGTYFGDRLWATTDSTGWISGHRVQGVLANGANATAPPLVFSYTPNIESSQYGPLTIAGTPPTYIVQIHTPPTVDVSATNYNNIIGPIESANTNVPGGSAGQPASNAPSMFTVLDPAQTYTHADPSLIGPWPIGGDAAGFANLLATGVRSFTLALSATLANIADAGGGTDAVEATMPASSLVYSALTVPTAGVPLWVEFDIKAGSASPLSTVQVRLQDNSSQQWWRRMITIPTTWRRYRFLYTPRSAPAALNVMFANTGVSSGTVDIGQVRVYHAYAPLAGGQFLRPLHPSTDGGVSQTGSVFQGSGAPSNSNGNNGDVYFRTDTPATANQRIYIKSAGAWVGIL